jgi:hypothetical protein
VLCFDCSASMAHSGLAHAKAAASIFLDSVEKTARDTQLRENIAIVVFGRTTFPLLPLTDDYGIVRATIQSLRVSFTLAVADCMFVVG